MDHTNINNSFVGCPLKNTVTLLYFLDDETIDEEINNKENINKTIIKTNTKISKLQINYK